MGIRNMRLGDTIIGVDTQSVHMVEEKGYDEVKARSAESLKRLKTFKGADLGCVDADDGPCQEMQPALC